MEYKEAEKFLEEIKKYGSVLGLENIKELLRRIGNPQDELKIVHIAGTNGKGSIFTFVQNILLEAGYHVGRYSSPAVFSKWEIIKYDGNDIEKDDVAACIDIIKKACDEMVENGFGHPTPFEVETAMAFLYFSKKDCDIVLLETGMGGETDATNVADKVLCSVIASISFDHMKFLGNTIKEITTAKCGIIKRGCPVVSSQQTGEAQAVIFSQVKQKESQLSMAGKAKVVSINGYETEFEYESSNSQKYNLKMKMMGANQLVNVATALEVIEVLIKSGFNITKENIKKGIYKSVWNGRMEVVCDKPLFVIDGAHNPGAVKMLKETIEMYFTNKRIAFIMGVLADKDYAREVEMITPRAVKVFTVTPDNERALDGEKLAKVIEKHNKNVEAVATVKEAVKKAVDLCDGQEADMVLAFGSLSYLGELKKNIINANS